MVYRCQNAPKNEWGLIVVPRTNVNQGKLLAEMECEEQVNNGGLAHCFAADTQILVEDGTTRSIDSIGIGEKVLVVDDLLGRLDVKPVLQIQRSRHKVVLEITLSTGSVIKTSTDQELGTVCGDVISKSLIKGAVLRQANLADRGLRSGVTVEKIEAKIEEADLYSLVIEKPYYYFVSEFMIAARCKNWGMPGLGNPG